MKIKECEFKGTKAIQISNEDLSILVLPDIGGKIASIYSKEKDFELLFQNKEEIYRKGKLYDDFSKFDASGFDDCFPNIDESMTTYESREIKYPDHGEVWSSKLDFELFEDRLKLSFQSKIVPYRFEKNIALRGNSLMLSYGIQNEGPHEIKCFYTMHCLLKCMEDMILRFPEGTKQITNVTKSHVLGDVGKIHPFPVTLDRNNKPYELNKICKQSANKFEKYYVVGEVKKGECGAYYPSKELDLKIIYDEKKLPYLGFWITEGGFRGDYNCALEPSNGYYDSMEIAEKNDKYLKLLPGCRFEFDIEMSIGQKQ